MNHFAFYNSHWEEETGVSCLWSLFTPHSYPNTGQQKSQRATMQDFLRHSWVTWVWLVIELRSLELRAATEELYKHKKGLGQEGRGLGRESEGRKVLLLSGVKLAKTASLMGMPWIHTITLKMAFLSTL